MYSTCFTDGGCYLLSGSEDTTGKLSDIYAFYFAISLLFPVYSPTVEHAGHGMSGLLPRSQLSSMGCVRKVCLDFLNFHGLCIMHLLGF